MRLRFWLPLFLFLIVGCKFWSEREWCEYRGHCDSERVYLEMMMCFLDSGCSDPANLAAKKQTRQQCIDSQTAACTVAISDYLYIQSKSNTPGTGGVCIFNC